MARGEPSEAESKLDEGPCWDPCEAGKQVLRLASSPRRIATDVAPSANRGGAAPCEDAKRT
jgi:hypothetical protein